MPKVYGYIRVSTEDQARHGLSLSAQEDRARAYFEFLRTKPGCEHLEWGEMLREEGASAYRLPLFSRPQGDRLWRLLRSGDHLVFVRLDRGFRNVRDFLRTLPYLEQYLITVHFLDLGVDLSTANGKLFATIVAAIAEWESALKGERVREALNQLRAKGRSVNGKAALGRRIVRKGREAILAASRRDEAIIKLICYYRDHLGMTYHKISDRIEAILARRENRPPLPRWEMHGKKRAWNMDRVLAAYFQADKIQRIAQARTKTNPRRNQNAGRKRQPPKNGEPLAVTAVGLPLGAPPAW